MTTLDIVEIIFIVVVVFIGMYMMISVILKDKKDDENND